MEQSPQLRGKVVSHPLRIVRVAIEPLVPDAVELRAGASPIPDRRWATALPDTLDLEPQQTRAAEVQPRGDLSSSLQPAEFKVKALSSGKTYRLEQASSQPLKVRNTSNHKVAVELQAMSFGSAGATWRPDDAELLKAAQVRFEPDSLTLEPGEGRTITGAVTMGHGKSLRGKNLVCVISAAISGQAVQTQIYSRLRADAQ